MKEKIKKWFLKPTNAYRRNQDIEIDYIFYPMQQELSEIWVNMYKTSSTGVESVGINLSPQECIEFGKLLYKVAYEAGYKK